MATYEELAPIISGTGITRNQVETYFENLPEPPAPQAPPAITAQKISALANIYFEQRGIEKRNGLLRVAQEVGLTEGQCKQIIAEIKTLKGVWDILQLQTEITAFADAGDGFVTVTAAGHGLSEDGSLTIFGTTNYDGAYVAVNVAEDTFDIEALWAGDDATGTVQREG